MNRITRTALPVALSGALVAGALAIPVIAQETGDDTTVEQPADEGRPGFGLRDRDFDRSFDRDEFVADVAAELGIEASELQAAVDSVKDDRLVERLDEAVADGRLTQQQADEIAAAEPGDERREVLDGFRLDELESRLAEKVAAGELTQAEADEILAAAEDGEWPRHRRGHREGGPREGGPRGGGPGSATADVADV